VISCLLLLLFTFGLREGVLAQTDTVHFSSLFSTNKPYRIYLPSDYNSSQKTYPVIYYFHGNQGDHKFNIEGVNELVNKASVILVAWNGRSEPGDMRPYNVGYHSNIKYTAQFKDYFLEFVHHIDSTYRTINDRSHLNGFISCLASNNCGLNITSVTHHVTLWQVDTYL